MKLTTVLVPAVSLVVVLVSVVCSRTSARISLGADSSSAAVCKDPYSSIYGTRAKFGLSGPPAGVEGLLMTCAAADALEYGPERVASPVSRDLR
jgi:hypothetical protein